MTAAVECAGCYRPIRDRFLLKVLDKDWHSSCVRCHMCRKLLDEKCFYKEGKMYCKDDFYRCFGPKCGGCGEAIHYQDFVRKARDKVYHLRCFTCSLCNKQLSTGEVLYLQPGDDSLVCKEDYLRTHQDMSFSDEEDDCDDQVPIPGFDSHHPHYMGATPPHLTPGHHSDSMSTHSLTPTPNKYEANNNLSNSEKEFGGPGNGGSGGPKLGGLGGGLGGTVGSGDDLDDDDDSKYCEDENKSPDGDGPGGKRRGPRTTIKAKQLEVLKTAFNQTPKPTRHIREQLAKETGLTMRVIQVWFQNKRSKERRMKQMTNGMVTGRGFFPGKGGRRGFPMIGDEFAYFPHDKPFHDFGPYPNFPPDAGFFPPGPMGFMGHPPGGPPPNMDQPLPMHGPGMGGPHSGPPGGGPPLGPHMPLSGPPGGQSLPPPPPGDSFPPSSISNNPSMSGGNSADGLPNDSQDGSITGNAVIGSGGGTGDFNLGDLPPPRPSPDFTSNSGSNLNSSTNSNNVVPPPPNSQNNSGSFPPSSSSSDQQMNDQMVW